MERVAEKHKIDSMRMLSGGWKRLKRSGWSIFCTGKKEAFIEEAGDGLSSADIADERRGQGLRTTKNIRKVLLRAAVFR